MPIPLFILGATATGKSDIALRLAEETGATLLVMDAMQVYRGLEIGVGKPTLQERARVRHEGLDLVEWTDQFNVAEYVLEAGRVIASSGPRPLIICGGTGLYFQALTQGLCEVPSASPELRAELSALSGESLRERLLRVDPGICPSLDLNNPRRVQRAIECMETTGRSLRLWQQSTPSPLLDRFQAVWLQRPQAELEQRLTLRVQQMLDAGWVEEVAGLLARSGKEKLARCPAIGYRELMEVCLNETCLPEAWERIRVKTRQYAKRQNTWLRRARQVVPLSLAHTDSDRKTENLILQLWRQGGFTARPAGSGSDL